jgi:hypothetical protein
MQITMPKWQVLQIIYQSDPDLLDLIDRAYEQFCSYCLYRGEGFSGLAEAARAFCHD